MLSLDHIVFAGKDLQSATKEYGNIALKSVKGGEHERWGTENYLAYFSNSCYIEWLGIQDLATAEQSNNPLVQHLVYTLSTQSQGPFQMALRTTRLDDYVTHFEKNGIPFTGPINGQRLKQDGATLHWRMLFPSYDYTKETLPFLIEWGQPEEERFDVSLVNSQAITSVQFGGTDEATFRRIYQLRSRPRTRPGRFRLRNATISFKNDAALHVKLA